MTERQKGRLQHRLHKAARAARAIGGDNVCTRRTDQIPINDYMICISQGRQIPGLNDLHGLYIMFCLVGADLYDLVHVSWVWICKTIYTDAALLYIITTGTFMIYMIYMIYTIYTIYIWSI